MKEQSAQARWEQRTQRPLLALAVAFAVAYAVPIVDTTAGHSLTEVCTAVEWVVWAAFAVDYLMRLAMSRDRRRFVRTHWMDLCAVVLPILQPLRLLRMVSTLILVGRRARMASQIQLTTYVAGAVIGLLMFGSLAVLSVERDSPNGNIRTLGDAVWWSFTTMTTVGYGDHAPTTGLGRMIAVGLMLSGIALLGVVTANIATWFIARFEKDDVEERRQTEAIEALTAEVRGLRAEVAALSGAAGSAPSGTEATTPTGVPQAAASGAAAADPFGAQTAVLSEAEVAALSEVPESALSGAPTAGVPQPVGDESSR